MANNKVSSKDSFLIPIGIAALFPTFNVAFIHKGNAIDKAFFFCYSNIIQSSC